MVTPAPPANSGPVQAIHPPPVGKARSVTPLTMEYHGIGAIDGEIYMAGGGNGWFSYDYLQVFNPETGWRQEPKLPRPYELAGSGVIDGKLHIFGGYWFRYEGLNDNHTVYDPVSNTWSSAAPLPRHTTTRDRTEFASCAIGGKLFAAGGQGDGDLDNLDIYDAALDSWTPGAPMPVATQSCRGAALDGIFYVVGGYVSSPSVNFLDSVYAYNPASDSWATGASLPVPVSDAPVVGYKGKLYVFGGYTKPTDPSFTLAYTDAVQIYDPATDSWTYGPPMTRPREGASAVVLGDLAYVIGGSDGGQWVNTMEVYDLQNARWYRLSPVHRSNAAGMVADGKLYLVGGETWSGLDNFDYGNVPLPLVESFDPATGFWSTRSPMPAARFSAAYGTIAGKLYVAGGFDPDINFTDTLQIYDPTTDTWELGPVMPSPPGYTPDDQQVGVFGVIGGKLYVFFTRNFSVSIYDPAAGSWTNSYAGKFVNGDYAGQDYGSWEWMPGATIGGRLYATGRDLGDGFSMDAFDPATATWTVDALVPRYIDGPVVVAHGKSAYSMAGNDGIGLPGNGPFDVYGSGWESEFQLYDTTSGGVTELPALYAGPGYTFAAVIGSTLYLAGSFNWWVYADSAFQMFGLPPLAGNTSYLRMTQRNDGLGVIRHPRIAAGINGPSSAVSTRNPRLGQNNRYR